VKFEERPLLKNIIKIVDLDKEIKASGCYNEIKDIDTIEYTELAGVADELDAIPEESKEHVLEPMEEERENDDKEDVEEGTAQTLNQEEKKEVEENAAEKKGEDVDKEKDKDKKVIDQSYIRNQVKKQIRNEFTKYKCKRNKNKDKKTMKQKESVKDFDLMD
jgi:hypothetical protein